MKDISSIAWFSYPSVLTQKSILKQYKRFGESKMSVKRIQQEVSKIVKTNYPIGSILPKHSLLLEQVESNREHIIIRLVRNDKVKISMHIIPSYFKIPSHTHPDTINAVHVLQGELQIEQTSLLTSAEKLCCQVNKGETCAGLCKFRNIHRMQSHGEPTIFLSFRVSKQRSQVFKKGLSFVSSFLLFISPNILVTQLSADKTTYFYTSNYLDEKNENILLANKLRSGKKSYSDLYRAVQIYKEESHNGNAEAQYWLGVMYFDGLGTTEDLDEALRWIAMSSDQHFPKAQKLLDHIIKTDDISDC